MSWQLVSQAGMPPALPGEAGFAASGECLTTHGHEALNDRAQKLLDGLPGFVFTAAGPIHVSRDLGHLALNLGAPEQPPAVSGYDVALVRNGRIAVLYTLMNAA